jgi:hypothetical protein
VTSVAITGSWLRYTVTATLPSNVGKTFGTNGNDYLAVRIWTSAGSTLNARTGSLGLQTITVDLWGARIDPAAVASDFVALPLEIVLAQCQRFYAASLTPEYMSVPAPNTTFAGTQPVYYPVQMRASVTPVFSGQVFDSVTSFTIFVQSARGYTVILVAAGNTNCTCQWSWTADAEL